MKPSVKKLIWIPVTLAGVFFGLLLLVSLMSNIVLSPSVSRKLIDRFAPAYYDGNMEFSRASISAFIHFPNITVDMDSLVLTYRADLVDASAPAGRIDTLASFTHFNAAVNTLSLLRGVIKVRDVHMTHPRLFMHVFPSGRSNWKIAKIDAGAKPKTRKRGNVSIPRIVLFKLSIDGGSYIEFSDESRDMNAVLRLKEYSFDGRLNTAALHRGVFSTAIDSLQVEGRLAQDTLRFDLDHFRVTGNRGHWDVDSKAVALMSTLLYGRLMVPFDLKGLVDVKTLWNGTPWINFQNVDVSLATMKLMADMEMEIARKMKLKGNVTIPPVDVQRVLDDYGYGAIAQLRPVTTDMTFSAAVDVDGVYNLKTGELPAFKASLDIPACFVRHSEINYVPGFELMTRLRCDQGGAVEAAVSKFNFRAPELNFDASGVVADILGDDPEADIECSMNARLDSLGYEMKRYFDIFVGGHIDMKAKGKFNLSYISAYNFSNADIDARINLEDVVLDSYDDALAMRVDKAVITAAMMDDRFREDSRDKDRSMGAQVAIEKARMVYPPLGDVRINDFTATFHNSSDRIEKEDSLRYHPLKALLTIGSVSLASGDTLSVKLSGSKTNLVMRPSAENERIPVYSLTSDNSAINAKLSGMKLNLKGLKLTAGAQMAELHRKRRVVTMIDSLNRLHPELAADSIWRFLVQNPHKPKLPHFIAGQKAVADAHKASVSVGDVIAKNLRKWDLDANVGISDADFSGVRMTHFNVDAKVRDRCMQLTNLKADTQAGNLFAQAFLSSRDSKNVKVGFDLDLKNVSAGEIIQIVPNIDNLAPMVRSFDGRFNCSVAAMGNLNPKTLSLVFPSLNGVIKLTGDNLHFSNDKRVTSIARLLWVKNASNATINHLDVEGVIRDNALEVFPFTLKLENWTLVLAGIQHLDESFNYHVSLVRNPFGLKFGADIFGKDFKSVKVKMGKLRYHENDVPSYSNVVKTTRDRVRNTIRDVFELSDINEKIHPEYNSHKDADEMEDLTDAERSVLKKLKAQ